MVQGGELVLTMFNHVLTFNAVLGAKNMKVLNEYSCMNAIQQY